MRRFLERLLARWGYDVSTAQDGNTALALVRNTPFDLILLDVRMPEMSGVHVCEELRTFSDAVVIMLTALNRPNDVVEGFLAGADDYIAKPFRCPRT